MFGGLKRFFQAHVLDSNPDHGDDPDRGLWIATVLLMVEVIRADAEVTEDEQLAMLKLVSSHFQLSEQETKDLIAAAEQATDEAIDLHSSTRLINENFDRSARCRILELLWRLVYADGVKDKYEEHIVRRIAELLLLSHDDFIAAKRVVEAGLIERD